MVTMFMCVDCAELHDFDKAIVIPSFKDTQVWYCRECFLKTKVTVFDRLTGFCPSEKYEKAKKLMKIRGG